MFSDTHSIGRMQSIAKGENGLGRNTHHRQSVDHLRRCEASKYGVVSLSELGNFIG